MPISFNDTVVVGPPKVASHNGVQSVMYPTSIQSCDHTQTWRLVIVEALQATTVIVPDYTLARVRGLVVPALHTGEQHGYIDVNFGSLERFYGKVNGPTDALVNITGTICSRYFGGRKCLILEGDKAHPEGWYLGLVVKTRIKRNADFGRSICISRAFEEFWATASVGSVIQAAGRFSGFARLALGTGDGDLTLFEPLHVQDISPGVVSIPHGWQNKAGGLRGWSQAIRS